MERAPKAPHHAVPPGGYGRECGHRQTNTGPAPLAAVTYSAYFRYPEGTVRPHDSPENALWHPLREMHCIPRNGEACTATQPLGACAVHPPKTPAAPGAKPAGAA